jgi:hypothetical protein
MPAPGVIHLPTVAVFMEVSERVSSRDVDRHIFGPETFRA